MSFRGGVRQRLIEHAPGTQGGRERETRHLSTSSRTPSSGTLAEIIGFSLIAWLRGTRLVDACRAGVKVVVVQPVGGKFVAPGILA